MGVLWAMPALQAALLAFFTWDAVSHWWYGWSLLLVCLVVGLLGGAVYVNAFTLLCRQVPPQLQEFSLSATCVADSCGIACADLVAILIQGCLYRWNGLPGAAYAC
jgi:battenin